MQKFARERHDGAIRRFRKDRDGTVAILFAVALVPLLLAAGGAVDYATRLRASQALDAVADASALAAARVAAERYRGGYADWNSVGVQAGQSTFAAGFQSTLSKVTVGAPVVVVAKNGAVMSATVAYSGQVQTNLLKLAQIQSLAIGNTMTAGVTLASYTDLHVVIDTSTSMGMAATVADQNAIQTHLGTNCFVGCHINAFAGSDNVASYRAAGATLRIDVLKTAVISALNNLQAKTAAGTVRVAVYTFDNTLKPVFALSSDLTAAMAAVNTIDLSTDGGGTNITYALNTLNTSLSAAGAGVNSGSPKGAVLLFTDGIQDHEQYHPATGWTNDPNWVSYSPSVAPSSYNNWDYQTIDPGACNPIKSKGYGFLVLNVQYVISASDLAVQQRYDDINTTLVPVLQSNVNACSTGSGYSYSANTPAQITTAVAAMFASAADTGPKLTN